MKRMKYRKGNASQMSEASMSFYFGLGLRFLGFKKRNCFLFWRGEGRRESCTSALLLSLWCSNETVV